MTRHAAITGRSARRLLKSLVDLRDEIGTAKNLVAAAYMACRALDGASGERAALCAVTNVARETLETASERLDQLIAAQSEGRAVR